MQQSLIVSTHQPNGNHGSFLGYVRHQMVGSMRGNLNQGILFDPETSGCINGSNACFQLSAFLIQFPHFPNKSGLYFRIRKGSQCVPPVEKQEGRATNKPDQVGLVLLQNTRGINCETLESSGTEMDHRNINDIANY
jgi:hypothetical protein